MREMGSFKPLQKTYVYIMILCCVNITHGKDMYMTFTNLTNQTLALEPGDAFQQVLAIVSIRKGNEEELVYLESQNGNTNCSHRNETSCRFTTGTGITLQMGCCNMQYTRLGDLTYKKDTGIRVKRDLLDGNAKTNNNLVMTKHLRVNYQKHSEKENSFLQYLGLVRRYANNSTRRVVCTPQPRSVGSGITMMAIATTDCDLCYLTANEINNCSIHMKASHYTPITCFQGEEDKTNLSEACIRCDDMPPSMEVNIVPVFEWCLENWDRKGFAPNNNNYMLITGKELGQLPSSKCSVIVQGDSIMPDANPLVSNAKGIVRPVSQCLQSITPALAKVILMSHSCSIQTSDELHWICGDTAYKWLPNGWLGRCGLAYVVPSFRYTSDTPEEDARVTQMKRLNKTGLHRHKRSMRWYDNQWYTELLSTFVPLYGTEVSLAEIRALAGNLQEMSRATSLSIDLLNKEQQAIRKMTMQNRMALDIILATQGGACAIIGPECCSWINDYSSNITEESEKIKEAGDEAGDIDKHKGS
eukprot:gi/632987017/ref/XP_007910561.1/ PREDICTED: uncharacterized protein LOC103191376 [Callorhinchus milii]